MKAVNVDEVLKVLHKYGQYIFVTDEKKYSSMVDEIANLEAVKQEPKKGHWIPKKQGRWVYAKCSECGTVHDVASNYCPNCGFLMDRNDYNEYIKTESEEV